MSRFLRDELIKLAPYTPGEQPSDMSEYIKLNTNESPYPPSERALSVKNLRPLNRYCDTEAIAFCFMAFCGKNKGAAFGEVTYGFYPVFCNLFGIDYKTVPLDSDLSLDPKKFYGLKRTIFIANPNAQTGIAMSLTDIEGILKNNPDDVVILDEA
jgi:histidinol-phosphate aminotransferase